MDAAIEFTAGAIAGASGVFVGHPFDTTKVCVQTAGSQRSSKFGAILSDVVRHGWKGFFRGLSFPLLSSAIINSVYFGVYTRTLSALDVPHSEDGDGNSDSSLSHVMLAGIAGGFAQWPLSSPMECIKTTMQSQLTVSSESSGQKFYSGPLDCARGLVKSSGWSAFFRGGLTLAWRDIPTFGVYVMTYEGVVSVAPKSGLLGQNGVLLLAGGLAGCATWTLALPADNVKSRLQADPQGRRYHSMLHCAREMYRQEGLRSFSKGLILVNVRGFIVSAITFWTWSLSMRVMRENVDFYE